MILRLDPPIPLTTPKGNGLAYFLTDYGIDYNNIWTVAIDKTGEWWGFDNTQVRAVKNITMGRLI